MVKKEMEATLNYFSDLSITVLNLVSYVNLGITCFKLS